MKPFLVIRVPVVLDEQRNPERRPRYVGPGTTIVGEFDTPKEASDAVKQMSFGDRLHHYYAFELRFSGDPDRKGVKVESAKPYKGSRPKLAVDNQKKEKRA